MAQRPFTTRQFLTSIAAVGLFAGGCENRSAHSQGELRPDSQRALVPGNAADETRPTEARRESPAIPEFNGSTDPSLIATTVKNYTQQMAPLIEQRPKPPEPAIAAIGDPSDVRWIKPGDPAKPTARPPIPVEVIPLVQPVIDAQPSSANQGLSVASALQPLTVPNPQSGMRISPDDVNRTVTAPRPAVLAADLEAKLSRQIQSSPRDLWAHLDSQLLHFLRDEQVPQLDALTSLPLEDRELVAAVMDGLTLFRNSLRADGNMLLSRKVKPLLDLADRLRSQADLNIPTLSLCTKVDAFGVYEPIDPVRFIAGKEHQAIIYCEVENFASSPMSDKKMWETKLSQEAVLYTESGLQVWVDKAGTVVDHSRNRRRDFFIVKKIKLPAALTIGRYLLKVTVEDQQAKRVAEQTMPIEIVAQMETAAVGTK